MNILHLIKSLDAYGGTPIKMLALAKSIDQKNFKQYFAVFSKCDSNLFSDFEKSGATVIEILHEKNYDFLLIRDIYQIIKEHRIDLVITHFARSDIYGTLAAKVAGKPVVKYLHGMLWNSSKVLQSVDSFVSSWRAGTICNSQATLRAAQKRGKVKKPVIIYNGVPDQSIQVDAVKIADIKSNLCIGQDDFVLGSVGGFIPLREHKTIIASLVILQKMGIPCSLVLIGEGPLEKEIKEQVNKLGLRNVFFLGYRKDVRELLNIFDVYINVSTLEGFGIAVIEAMQSELPVILANSGALPELIVDGESGFLIPPSDEVALAEKIAFLHSNRLIAQRIGTAAREHALKSFSVERYAREMENIFFKTCQECSSGLINAR